MKTSSLPCIKPNAAGIDIGSRSHFVAVPSDRDIENVKEFGFFTEDLYKLCQWLKKCSIETVAMEATGSYWIPLYDILISSGFEVYVVNARHIKNVSGRKTDVQDCQWIQQLHSYGLLRASFIPDALTSQLRHLMRYRDNLLRQASRQLQLIQKFLVEMNIQLMNAVSDIAGDTAMKIIRAICAGKRDAKKLAGYRDPRCKNSQEVIEKSLLGNYKPEVLFSLNLALESYDHYQRQICSCNKEIEHKTTEFTNRSNGQEIKKKKREAKRNNLGFDTQTSLLKMVGVNLLEIPGMNSKTALTVVSEIGPEVDKWKNSKHFASWLGLSPNNKVSGGKKLSSKTTSSSNKVKFALRMALLALERSPTSLGAFFRRMKARLGAPKAITAAAHKLAVIIYQMIKTKKPYEENGPLYFEKAYKIRAEHRLKQLAKLLGYEISPVEELKTEDLESAEVCIL